jgi:hypothetical protein
MKYIRISLAVVATLAVLGIASWYFVGWSLNRAFQSATQQGGGLRKVVDVTEATVGSTLARGDVRLQPGKDSGEGALAFYEKNPQALPQEKKYFETWQLRREQLMKKSRAARLLDQGIFSQGDHTHRDRARPAIPPPCNSGPHLLTMW